MEKIVLYHGSKTIVKQPIYGEGKTYNDYGRGFYCTESLELAKEWACTESRDGYANEYELELEGLNVLNLSSDEYTILHWLALLLEYRIVRISTPLMRRGKDWLKRNFSIDIQFYDVIVGYRADDSYFSFARAFLNNEISLSQLSYAMRLGKLGEQCVLKSEKAFKQIRFNKALPADHTEYYVKRKARDDAARMAFCQELEKDDIDGLYIRDLIREEVHPDDARIR